jgi:hypothetical protein
MIKRVTWWAAGAVMGAAGSQWAQRRFKRRVSAVIERYAPPAVVERAKANTKVRTLTVVDGVKSAIDTGKAAADSREQELRTKLGTRAR